MATYAATTQVTPERRRQEIERTLARYGATRFGYLTEPTRAMIACELQGRRMRFAVPFPEPAAYTKKGYDQAIRQRWAALALIIKAKLEAVESGIATFDQSFMGDILLPDGQTVAETLAPRFDAIYRGGELPPLLAGTERRIIALPPAHTAEE
jgi:hypothetical protein